MSQDPEARTNVEKQLGEYERAVMSEIESSGDRVAVHEALKHLMRILQKLKVLGLSLTY